MCSLSLGPVLISIHKIILFIYVIVDSSKCSCVQILRGGSAQERLMFLPYSCISLLVQSGAFQRQEKKNISCEVSS